MGSVCPTESAMSRNCQNRLIPLLLEGIFRPFALALTDASAGQNFSEKIADALSRSAVSASGTAPRKGLRRRSNRSCQTLENPKPI